MEIRYINQKKRFLKTGGFKIDKMRVGFLYVREDKTYE